MCPGSSVFKSAGDHFSNHFSDFLQKSTNSDDKMTEVSQSATSISFPKPVNVSQVKHLSPFRYPGGKTWLVPFTRKWIQSFSNRPSLFLEPFAGGAMVGLSAAAENIVDRVEIWEIDQDVAAIWKLIFSGNVDEIFWLCQKILDFDVNFESVKKILETDCKRNRDLAFRTIIKNRMQRGGIMAPGAGLIKSGENGKGLTSRWYPETIVKRIQVLQQLRDRVTFVEGDAFEAMSLHADKQSCVTFNDPPYTASGKRAGRRLYTHNEIDHFKLFEKTASMEGPALLTYDDSQEVRKLSSEFGFHVETVQMKSTHHALMRELTIFKS